MMSPLTLITVLSSLIACTTAAGVNVIFPANASTARCDAEFLSVPGNLDGPKFKCINDTVLDLWYFDAISSDQKTSIVISFYLSTTNAFPFLTDPTNVVPTVGISASWPNGSTVSFEIPAGEAIIASNDEISDGQYYDGDFEFGSASWYGSDTDNASGVSGVQYDLIIDSPKVGISGTVKMVGVAPPHYPCTSDATAAGANEQVAPNLGWSNIMPAATATVDFTFQGTKLAFSGIGYHDKNWSDKPFLDSVGSWYWGHTTLGDYNLVWFDFLTPTGVNYVSSYVAHQGTVIASSCEAGAIKVRPTGNTTYPPTTTSGAPNGFEITVNLGNKGHMMVNVEGIIVASGGGLYNRGLAKSWGNINGDALPNGTAMWDAFSLESASAVAGREFKAMVAEGGQTPSAAVNSTAGQPNGVASDRAVPVLMTASYVALVAYQLFL